MEEKQEDKKKGEALEGSSASKPEKHEDADTLDDALVDELLADGTPAKKEIRVQKDKYDEKNEKSKLLDELSPLLSKLKERPELVDEALRTGTKDSLEVRVERIEKEEKQKKQLEVRQVVKDALEAWPDVKEHWGAMRPIIVSLESQGFSYRDSVERAYYALNPEALEKERKSIAQRKINAEGAFSSKGSQGVVIASDKQEDLSFMTDADRAFFTKAGLDPKLALKHKNIFEKFKDL